MKSETRFQVSRADLHTMSFLPDPDGPSDAEGLQAVLRPLFVTSFLIDDFLTENACFGATRLLQSSASSKTALGTTFCLARRRSGPSPQGWGPGGLRGRLGAAWAGFVQALQRPGVPGLRIVHRSGPAALQQAYGALLSGQADAGEGLVMSLQVVS